MYLRRCWVSTPYTRCLPLTVPLVDRLAGTETCMLADGMDLSSSQIEETHGVSTILLHCACMYLYVAGALLVEARSAPDPGGWMVVVSKVRAAPPRRAAVRPPFRTIAFSGLGKCRLLLSSRNACSKASSDPSCLLLLACFTSALSRSKRQPNSRTRTTSFC